MTKRIVSCLLALLSAAILLCSCGSDTPSASSGQTAAENSVQEESKAEETTKETTKTTTATKATTKATTKQTTTTTATTACEHDWIPADCQNPETCSKCGETRGSRANHVWEEATCSQPKTCRVCGETVGSPRAHYFELATCTQPKTCRYCGATEGQPKGHNWKEATYDAPKTCTRCGATEGKKLSVSDNWKGSVGTSIPQSFTFTNYKGQIESEIKITKVSIEFKGNNYRDTGEMIIKISGTKTYDINGDGQSRSGKIGIKVYDSAGNVWKEYMFYTPSLTNGETFKDKEVSFVGVPHGSYVVKLLDVNTG